MSAPRVPVLMYHALLAQPVPGLHRVHIEGAMLAQHMAWLHTHGYQAITVAEWYRRWLAGRLAPKTVVLTFDDGYWSLVKRAVPVLKKYGFAATLFLTTDFVGMPAFPAAFNRAVPPGDRPLAWAEVRALQAAGWDIQAHSCTHRAHAALPDAQLAMELERSQQLIADQLRSRVEFYAFPYGNYSTRVLHALVAAGYRAGFAVHSGPVTRSSDPRRLPRIEINTGCLPNVFENLVRTGYNSAAERYRAQLRNLLYHFPSVKDALQRVFAGSIN